MKAFSIILLALLLCPVQAKTITVDSSSGSISDIQAAIDLANDGDTVVLLPGTYQRQNQEILGINKAIFMQSQDPTDSDVVAATVIQCPMDIWGNRDMEVIVSGLTFSGGESRPALKCIVVDLKVSKCVFKNNYGGGLSAHGSNLQIEKSLFENNVALKGGGISLAGGQLNANHCVFLNNEAEDRGGAICSDGGSYGDDQCVNSLFVANHAGKLGGGIYSEKPSILRNCTVAGNTAGLAGGSLCVNSNLNVNFINTIVAHNKDSQVQGRAIAVNSVTHSGRGGSSRAVQADAAIHRSAEALEAASTSMNSCFQKDFQEEVGPFANVPGTINESPQFVRIPSDGGDGWGDNPDTPDTNEGANDDYGDLHLQKTSPCLDAGATAPSYDTPLLDLDGNLRVMGGRIDMGAYEDVIASYVVTQPAGGETFSASSDQAVTWESKLSSGLVDLLISTDSGQTWQPLETELPDTGTYRWSLSDQWASLTCQIRVVPSIDVAEAYVQDSGQFSIQPHREGIETVSPWPSLGGGYDRSGLAFMDVSDSNAGKWGFDTKAPVWTPVTVGAEDHIHVACDNGKLYTLDQQGHLLWCYEIDTSFTSAPSVGPDGTVHVGDQKGRLHAIDPNGLLRWTYDTGGFIHASPAVGQDSTVYVASQAGSLTALNAAGTKLWEFATWAPYHMAGAILASPSIGKDGAIYVGGLFDPNLYALDPVTGETRWACSFVGKTDPNNPKAGCPLTAPVVAADGTIYQTLLDDTRLFAIGPEDGQILWATDMLASIPPDAEYVSTSGWSEPALGPDGTIYVASDDAFLRAVTPLGQIKWVIQLGSSKGYTLVVDPAGLIYAAAEDGTLTRVNENGSLLGHVEGEDASFSYPVVMISGQDGQFIVSDANNKVWRLVIRNR